MSEAKSEQVAEDWNNEIQRLKATGKYPKWPNEAMLKVIFGGENYLEEPVALDSGSRVLDVGCGYANNLLPFLDLGCECKGVELHPEMANTTQKIIGERGYEIEVKVGSNRSIPYPDHYFDLLLSVNTLHYEGSLENFLEALREFRRVLKPGGALYISTVGPEHEIYRRAEVLGKHCFQICDWDFRDGENFFFCDNERYLKHYCSQVFTSVETGLVTEKLMRLPLDFLIALCR